MSNQPKYTRSDVYSFVSAGDEANAVNALNADDMYLFGTIVKNRIDRLIESAAEWRRAEKEKYRAEILAEVCQGGDA